jgi:heat shock protein HtpX
MTYLTRSLFTFLLLYGLVVVVADKVYFRQDLSVPLITEIAIALVLLQYLIGPIVIRWLLDIDWGAELPARNQQFLKELCAAQGLPVPPVGIIHSAMPNAFTFGRIQSDASIVVTSGLLEALTPEEVNAVLSHETGHIKHWDFLTMTAASIVPLLLYHLYYIARRFRDSHPATWAAYGAYWVSQFLVLSLSRTREYWADDFAAVATGDASHLSSGLVKICYGMAKVEREHAWAKQYGTATQKAGARNAALLSGKIGVLGISSAQAAFMLSGPSPEAAAAMMRWDLENPWARIYQLAATHPLTALRIKALNKVAGRQGQTVRYPLPEPTRINWANFPLEIFLWAAPWICGAALLLLKGLTLRSLTIPPPGSAQLLCVALLVTWIARIAFRYQGQFALANVRTLAEDITPSQMHPRAVSLQGEIVGRGQPGAFWSPDLLFKDETGILFMVDRQSIPLARFILSQGTDRWVGQRVTLEGWYRRGMTPFIELSRITGEQGDSHRSYSRWIQMAAAVAVSTVLYFVVSL